MKNLPTLLFTLLIGALPLRAQSEQSSSSVPAEPRNVTYCELAKDPASYNHELVRLTAFVTHGFEDFHLAEPNCVAPQEHFSIWVMYGGTAESNTIYCCPGEGSQETRSEALTVEGVKVPLIDDAVFRQFTSLLRVERDTTVRVTVVGTFFSGAKQTANGSTFWSGAGHMGCCSLFVIQRVEWFGAHAENNVDYSADAGWYESVGCEYGSLRYLKHVSVSYAEQATGQAIAQQRLADSGAQLWAFNNPDRVALETLKPFYKDQTPVLRSIKKTSARQVFQWRHGKKSVVVVVARPYWLSFYSKSGSIAWVSTTVKEAYCR